MADTDAALREEIRRLLSSEYWKLMRRFLVNRRDQLFREEPDTDLKLAMNRGALHEVDTLLRAPEIALYQMAQHKVEPLEEDLQPRFRMMAPTGEPL